MTALGKALLDKIEPLSEAKIVFVGFSLPPSFGGATELEFGNAAQADALGLSAEGVAMGKSFVKSAIEDLFSEDSELEETAFHLTEEGSVFTVTALEED
ncbi:MAG: hypothetical protein ACE5F7_03665 [Nitrospiria bacterium]